MKLFKKKKVLPVLLFFAIIAVFYFPIVVQFSSMVGFWGIFHVLVPIIFGLCSFVIPLFLIVKRGWC